ncbi:MAG: HD domain-containing protein [Candidatus Nitrosotenuis sp.]|nr:MAG: HD domain-containing protein [Candidatus Nitrosotenuis sp.]
MTTNTKSKVKSAELFAKKKHSGQLRKDGKTTVHMHLKSVVNRLKNIEMTDEDVLAAAWLHDIVEDTDTTFDEIDQLFGKKVASLVLSLTKDNKLSKRAQMLQYVKQLRRSSLEAKMIKLCDIASNLKQVHISSMSNTKKIKTIMKIIHYTNAIKSDILKNIRKYPDTIKIIEDINEVALRYNQKPIDIKLIK